MHECVCSGLKGRSLLALCGDNLHACWLELLSYDTGQDQTGEEMFAGPKAMKLLMWFDCKRTVRMSKPKNIKELDVARCN